jgi:hypothetical protein
MGLRGRDHRRQAIVAVGVFVGLIVFGPSALAKGPSQAVIEGPGLASPVALREKGSRGIGPVLSTMVEASGFLSGLFGDDEMRARRPDGELGPRYRVSYTVDGLGRRSVITQYVFPFAAAGPVTYMPPGQRYWRGNATGGGWYTGGFELSRVLNYLGVQLPSAPKPVRSAGAEGTHGMPAAIAVGVALAAGTAIFVLVWRMEARKQLR